MQLGQIYRAPRARPGALPDGAPGQAPDGAPGAGDVVLELRRARGGVGYELHVHWEGTYTMTLLDAPPAEPVGTADFYDRHIAPALAYIATVSATQDPPP